MISHISRRIALLTLLAGVLTIPSVYADSAPQIIDDLGDKGTRIGIVTQNRATVTWGPTLDFFLYFDGHAKSDAIEVTLLKDGKVQDEPWMCDYISSVKGYQKNQTTAFYPYPLHSVTCSVNKNIARTDGGVFQLALNYKQPLMGKEYDLGTLEFEILEIAHGSQNNPKKTFALDWDHMLGTATIFPGTGRGDLKTLARTATRANYGDNGISDQLVMSFWTKHERESDPGSTVLTCLKGDEVIKESRPGTGKGYSYWTFNEDKSKSVIEWKHQTFSFMQFYLRRESPEKQRGGMGAYFLAENPGDYRCVATAGGAVVGELQFAINGEGAIVGRQCGAEISRPGTVHEVTFLETATTTAPLNTAARNAPNFGRVKRSANCRS